MAASRRNEATQRRVAQDLLDAGAEVERRPARQEERKGGDASTEGRALVTGHDDAHDVAVDVQHANVVAGKARQVRRARSQQEGGQDESAVAAVHGRLRRKAQPERQKAGDGRGRRRKRGQRPKATKALGGEERDLGERRRNAEERKGAAQVRQHTVRRRRRETGRGEKPLQEEGQLRVRGNDSRTTARSHVLVEAAEGTSPGVPCATRAGARPQTRRRGVNTQRVNYRPLQIAA